MFHVKKDPTFIRLGSQFRFKLFPINAFVPMQVFLKPILKGSQ
jgi:hypothetical protein